MIPVDQPLFWLVVVIAAVGAINLSMARVVGPRGASIIIAVNIATWLVAAIALIAGLFVYVNP